MPPLLLLLLWAPALKAGPAEETAATASNLFASDLYAHVAKQEGNLVFSPYGIGTALSMTFAGAAGDTAQEMRNALYLPETPSPHNGHEALRRRLLAAAGNDAELNIANALWGQTESAFLPGFIGMLRDLYGAPIERLDFKGAPGAAAKRINAWVKAETRGRIPELVRESFFNPRTRLVLTNALHLKAAWAHPFDKERTTALPFMLANGEKVNAPMMRTEESFAYVEEEGVRMVELPFHARKLSMVILLPTGNLAEFEPTLSSDLISRGLATARNRKIDLMLPRFETASSFELGAVLSAMGMQSAFTEAADFSGMNASRDLFLAAVHHKARVTVDEEGTEAAAATAALMELKEEPGEPLAFHVDRPFLYLIRERTTGCILFLGRVAVPTRSE